MSDLASLDKEVETFCCPNVPIRHYVKLQMSKLQLYKTIKHAMRECTSNYTPSMNIKCPTQARRKQHQSGQAPKLVHMCIYSNLVS